MSSVSISFVTSRPTAAIATREATLPATRNWCASGRPFQRSRSGKVCHVRQSAGQFEAADMVESPSPGATNEFAGASKMRYTAVFPSMWLHGSFQSKIWLSAALEPQSSGPPIQRSPKNGRILAKLLRYSRFVHHHKPGAQRGHRVILYRNFLTFVAWLRRTWYEQTRGNANRTPDQA
jgi:hypothetical protein